MNQKKLHKLVESIASKDFSSEKELLISVINQIIKNEDIKVTGGRIWKLSQEKRSYKILYQTGNFGKLSPGFEIQIKEYPTFDLIAQERTI